MPATAYHFFLSHAGYSYDPKTQTPMQGRIEGAKKLTKAEQWACETGMYFVWEISDINASDFSDENYPLWDCFAYQRTDGGSIQRGVIGAVDFGTGETPDGSPYARVVCAELALDLMEEAAHPA